MTSKTLALQLMRLLNEGDLDGAAALFAPDAELCFPRFAPRRVFRGDAELREFVGWLTAVLPLHTLAVDRVTSSGDSATLEFETAGTSRAGHDFDNTGVLVVDARDGLIRALRVYLDTADLARVLDTAPQVA